MMNITIATVNIENNVITLQNAFGECFEFDMNEYRTLPQWAEKELKKLHFTKQIGNCMFFE